MLSVNALLVALTAFTALSSAAPSPYNAPLHVPLTRRASTRRSTNSTATMERFSQAADFIRKKYGFISAAEFERRQSSTGFAITNQVCLRPLVRVPRIASRPSPEFIGVAACAFRVQIRATSAPSTLAPHRKVLTSFLTLVCYPRLRP